MNNKVKVFVRIFTICSFPGIAFSISNLNLLPNNFEVTSLNRTLGFEKESKTIFIYGIININCPCSRESLQAFEEIAKSLDSRNRLIVFDIGASSEASFQRFKKVLSPQFELRYDPSKKSAKTFNAKVTPTAFILKDNQLIYQSAVIDPSKNPSPNYLADALKSALDGGPIENKAPFGCMIEW